MVEQVSGRSWTWGPEPITEALREPFVEGPEGQRAVQYFDKSRMEVTDPTMDPNSQWYVTNGLLPIELMTGRMQVAIARLNSAARPRFRRLVILGISQPMRIWCICIKVQVPSIRLTWADRRPVC